jgi:Tol biopolymer transport system component
LSVGALVALNGILTAFGWLAEVASAARPGQNGDILFVTGDDPGAPLPRQHFWRVHPGGTGRSELTPAAYDRLVARAPRGPLDARPAPFAGVTIRRTDRSSVTIATSAGEVHEVAWSADGALLALTTQVDPLQTAERSRLFTVRPDGTDLHRVFTAPAHLELTGIAFSPDGRHIATAVNARTLHSTSRLITASISGVRTHTRTLVSTARNEMFGSLDWSPRDGRLVYSTMTMEGFPSRAQRGRLGISTVRVSGGRPRHLDSAANSDDAGVSWSPNGTRIVYLGDCGPPPAPSGTPPTPTLSQYGVCTMRPDGSDRRAVALGTAGSANPPVYVLGIAPVWLPRSSGQ